MFTPARQCNNHLANAWQLAQAGDTRALIARFTAAMTAAQAADLPGLAGEIDYARQHVGRVGQIYLVAMINRLWTRSEARCIQEEAARPARRQPVRLLIAA